MILLLINSELNGSLLFVRHPDQHFYEVIRKSHIRQLGPCTNPSAPYIVWLEIPIERLNLATR